jgi:uncharacterized protein YndB with AHSA1/START domain
VPTTRRTRTISASPESVFVVVADPEHMPRWWPGVSRMEGVHEGHFTQVILTKKGRPVRVDFRMLESEPPGGDVASPAHVSWEQDIVGTPFERLLNESITEVEVAPADGGSVVKIEQRHKLRGYSRYGGFMLRRATRRKLDEALESLERILS